MWHAADHFYAQVPEDTILSSEISIYVQARMRSIFASLEQLILQISYSVGDLLQKKKGMIKGSAELKSMQVATLSSKRICSGNLK